MKKLYFAIAMTAVASGCSNLPSFSTQLAQEQLYYVEWIGERPLIDSSHLSITLGKNMRAHGLAGCNNWFAEYKLTGKQLRLDKFATSRKLCAPALMEQEQRYLEALSQVTHWDFSKQGQLQLWPENGAPIRLWPDATPQ